MKLYSVPRSPFAARVRLSIYRKGLTNIDICSPPEGGLKADSFLALNPMGRIPTLVLDSGVAIPESATIVEYLEDVFPVPSLRPGDPEDLARARLFSRLPDIYFENAPRILMRMRDPATRVAETVASSMAALHRGLTYIDHFVEVGSAWAVGGKPSIADSALVPVLNVVDQVSKIYQQSDLLDTYPRLRSYWDATREEPVHARVIAEMLATAPSVQA